MATGTLKMQVQIIGKETLKTSGELVLCKKYCHSNIYTGSIRNDTETSYKRWDLMFVKMRFVSYGASEGKKALYDFSSNMAVNSATAT